MGDECTRTSENCKNIEDDKIVDFYVPNRHCAFDQQGSFIQRGEQLSAVSTFECASCIDISHDNCSHPNLTVV